MLQEGEALLKNAGQHLRHEYRSVRDRVGSVVSAPAYDRAVSSGAVENSVLTRSRGLVNTTDRFVQERPWSAVAAAVSIGILIGIVITRK